MCFSVALIGDEAALQQLALRVPVSVREGLPREKVVNHRGMHTASASTVRDGVCVLLILSIDICIAYLVP